MGTDISSMFGGISNAGNSSYTLSDYASIKNGSYKKLMKAYYAQEKEESEAAGGDSHAKLLSVKSTADSLKEAADALQSDKLWQKKEIVNKDEETGEESKTFDYDWDAITKAVKSFVDAYNNTLERAGSSDTKDVLMVGSWMAKMTSKNANVLARAGIEIGNDNKMTLNEEKLKNNAGTAQFIFKGYNSFADKISYKASQMSQGAARSAEKMGAAYNKKGEYTGGISSSIKDKVNEATGKKKSNIITANTDKVDQEIKNLKSKRDSLKQKINSEYNTEKRREYEKELKQVENELAVKDTEQYRKNNSVFF
jgi:flagellar capping protein FliD